MEAGLVGGECPYWACIPTKMMVRAAGLLAEARRIPGMAGDASVRPDWAPVHQRIGEEATDPEIASTGLTEAQAREQGLPIRTGIAQLPSSARGWIHKAGNDGLIKLMIG